MDKVSGEPRQSSCSCSSTSAERVKRQSPQSPGFDSPPLTLGMRGEMNNQNPARRTSRGLREGSILLKKMLKYLHKN